ncbi:MAG: PadR family transcriptional regulator [Gemmatimonadales bacterium]|nr:MAG: PadR family transcriptional regulator [Gemmatimonadales bacterium]
MHGKVELIQGTLDLLVLRALSAGPMHGYGILDWLRERTEGDLRLEDAALYPALHRMEARGLVEAEWGLSENNRRAKYYQLTASGKRELHQESAVWMRYVSLMAKVLTPAPQPA